jgi:hypothetical protein
MLGKVVFGLPYSHDLTCVLGIPENCNAYICQHLCRRKFNDTKGVAVLLKYLKDDEQEQVVSFFRNGRVHTVIVTDDCSSDLWPQVHIHYMAT